MKLHEYDQHKNFLDYEGVYEIGFIRDAEFCPKYVGKTVNLYVRMKAYNNPAQCHNDHIYYRLFSEYRNLWFHVIRIEDAAWTESKLMSIYKIKDEGLYEYNCRYERVHEKRSKSR